MKIVVIGASGLVGGYLYEHFKKDHFTIGTFLSNSNCKNFEKLDICDKQGVNELFKRYDFDMIMLPAALTNVDWCETHKEETYKINVEGTKNIVLASKKINAKIVYFSTDYVFDGSKGPYGEEDAVNPLSYYGLTKLLAENEIKNNLDNYLIARVTWVYGVEKSPKNFATSLVQTLKSGLKRKVPVDQFATPTYVQDICLGVEKLINDKYIMNDESVAGIYNISGNKWLSRYEFALKIAGKFNLDSSLIIPVETKDLSQPAKRPLKSGLKIEKIIKEMGFSPFTIEEALSDMKNKMQ